MTQVLISTYKRNDIKKSSAYSDFTKKNYCRVKLSHKNLYNVPFGPKRPSSCIFQYFPKTLKLKCLSKKSGNTPPLKLLPLVTLKISFKSLANFRDTQRKKERIKERFANFINFKMFNLMILYIFKNS